MALINTTTTGIQGTTIYADGTGSLTIQQNGATLGVYGSQPAFSAIRTTSNISLSISTWTKVTLNGTDFDTNNSVNTSTGVITPNVAGYYQLSGSIYVNYSSSAVNRMGIRIYKNGAHLKGDSTTGTTAFYGVIQIGSLVYMNGTTDYLELYALQASSSDAVILAAGQYTYLTGVLVKAA